MTKAPAASPSPVTAADTLYAALARPGFALVWLAARTRGAARRELDERTGRLPPAGSPLVWFHGASAGEMAAAASLAALLRQAGFVFHAAFTATNRAGLELAEREKAAADVATFAPWDSPRWVARAFDCWRPVALFLVETELWPRLILEAAARQVPVFCVSARIYPRDVRGYRAARRLIAPTLGRVTAILAQSDSERQRFIALGAVPDCCVVAGSLKHVVSAPAPASRLRAELGLGADERVVVWGSLHADELAFLPSALAPLAAAGARLIVAPRHARTAAAVAQTAERHGWTAWRRRTGVAPRGWRLLVLDTVGELRHAYAMAEIAVIGGGFGRHGGHNLLEPLAAGVPVIFGPHTQHVADDARAVGTAAPEACVATPDELACRLGEWLADAPRRREVGARQRAAVADGETIAKRYVAVLSPWLREQGLSSA